jgi:hypothetical protein
MKNPKDQITNILAVLLVIGEAVNAYLQSSTEEGINWMQLGLTVVLAVTSYFTGKNPNGTTKDVVKNV